MIRKELTDPAMIRRLIDRMRTRETGLVAAYVDWQADTSEDAHLFWHGAATLEALLERCSRLELANAALHSGQETAVVVITELERERDRYRRDAHMLKRVILAMLDWIRPPVLLTAARFHRVCRLGLYAEYASHWSGERGETHVEGLQLDYQVAR